MNNFWLLSWVVQIRISWKPVVLSTLRECFLVLVNFFLGISEKSWQMGTSFVDPCKVRYNNWIKNKVIISFCKILNFFCLFFFEVFFRKACVNLKLLVTSLTRLEEASKDMKGLIYIELATPSSSNPKNWTITAQ